jgi:sec-independent protein translocase protein TatB
LFVLALLLFGPKRLPALARELGKWVGEFRRASNEFKMQMEDELRQSEQAERTKQIAAMEAAAPVTPAVTEPVGMIEAAGTPEGALEAAVRTEAVESPAAEVVEEVAPAEAAAPLPIATSGEMKIMPPATGLPKPRSERRSALGGLVDSIPARLPAKEETVSHGD